MPWRYGTTENLAVQTFGYNDSDYLTNAVLTAQVPGFSVVMECDPAEIGSSSFASRPWMYNDTFASFLVADVSGPGYQLINVSLGQNTGNGYFHITNTTVGHQSNYQGLFDYYVCNTGFDYANAGNPHIPQPNATSPDDYRFLLTRSEVSWYYNWTNATEDAPDDATWASNWTIARSIGLLCKPSYSIDTYEVTLVPFNQTLQRANIIPNTSASLAGFDLKDLLDGIVNSVTAATFGQGGDDYIITSVPPMFELLAGLNNNSRQEPLIDSNLLLNLSTQALVGIGTQFAQSYLKQDHNQSLSGLVVAPQQRLLVKPITVGLLLTTLGILAIAVCILIRIRPRDSAPCATESLASAAAILAASKSLRQHFQAQNPGLDNSIPALENYDYQTVVDAQVSFTIHPVLPANQPQNIFPSSIKGRGKRAMQQWWRPIATAKWFIACLLLLPLVLIAVLEVIQQMSDHNHGIVGLNSSNDYHLAISYVPVFIMLLVSAVYGALDSTLSMFASFLALRRGNAPAARSISLNLVSKLPPYALYLSLRSWDWVTSFTVFAAFTSSFLTIVPSGLYSPETVQASHAIVILQMDALNLSHLDVSQDDNLAGTTTKLTLLYNLSYPTWTYDNLVFPSFAADIPSPVLG